MTTPPPPTAPEGGVRDEVTRAICCPLGCNGGHGSGCVSYQVADVAVQVIAIVQRALPPLAAQAGAEPTGRMLAAGLEWALAWMKQNGVTGLSPFSEYPSPTETLRGAYKAMIAATPAQAGAWMPIETAPRDGTRVLICAADNFVETAFWSTSVWVTKGGAWINDVNRSDTMEFAPTHWQPLPAPPVDAMGDERGKETP